MIYCYLTVSNTPFSHDRAVLYLFAPKNGKTLQIFRFRAVQAGERCCEDVCSLHGGLQEPWNTRRCSQKKHGWIILDDNNKYMNNI